MICNTKIQFNAFEKPDNRISKAINLITDSYVFDGFIFVCIIINIILMASAYEGSSLSYKGKLAFLNNIFTYIFILECVLKLIAFGIKGYF